MREIYRARRDLLAAEVGNAFGPDLLQGLAAGCHALLRLPDGTSENAVVATVATMGVRVNGLGHYRFVAADREVDLDPRPPALVLGFGNVSEHQISRGIDKLATAVREVSSATSGRSGAGIDLNRDLRVMAPTRYAR